jgi:hypothetical protein
MRVWSLEEVQRLATLIKEFTVSGNVGAFPVPLGGMLRRGPPPFGGALEIGPRKRRRKKKRSR